MPRARCTLSTRPARSNTLSEADADDGAAVVPPVEWPEQWTRPPRVSRAVFGRVVGWVFVGVLVIVVVWRIATGRFDALAGDAVVAGLALLAFGVSQPRRPRGAPEFVNSVVLTRGVTAPNDSWVHLIRDRGTNALLVAGILVLGAAIAAGGVLGLLAVAAPPHPSEGSVLRVIGSALCLAGGAALFVLGALLWRGRSRNASFGRAPSGLALGAHGILSTGPASEGFVPWESIRAARAERREDARGDASRWILLTRDTGDEISVPADALVVHPWAVWAMIASAVNDPEWRARLGTGAAHDELSAWSRGATVADPAPRW